MAHSHAVKIRHLMKTKTRFNTDFSTAMI